MEEVKNEKSYRNYVEITGNDVEIYNRAKTDFIAVIDLSDYERDIRDYSVHLTNGRPAIHVNGRKVLLYRFIMGVTDPRLTVYHIRGSESLWDNRRSNLRIATYRENAFNRDRRSDNTSGVTGVSYDKSTDRWVAKICNVYLGSYKTIEEAAKERAKMETLIMGPLSVKERERRGQ